MALLAPSNGALNELISICEKYAASHGLVYNVRKTVYMVFQAPGVDAPDVSLPVLLNGAPVDRVNQFKYLGHFLTDNLKDDADVERERRALAVRANMLARRFARCTEAVKITLFRAYCTSLYTGALWVACTQRSLASLRVQYNNAFRALLGLPRFCSASAMFAGARVDNFTAVLRKKMASLLIRIRGSPNSLLKTLAVRNECSIMQHLIKIPFHWLAITTNIVLRKY
ncbi:uncharacterized protein [Choristoneura fumiferana]|uniref:uncharacterized protein n=1 Tax=Choristoneura fumiferana TaxID=7141 RepID=UPI003D15AD51